MMEENKGFSTVTDTTTDFDHLMEYMNAGVFKQKVEALLSECASGVVNHGNGKQKGKVILTFSLGQVGQGEQVNIQHSIQTATPTKRGKKGETDTTETTFFVGRGGKLTFDQPRSSDNGQYSLDQEADGLLKRDRNNR